MSKKRLGKGLSALLSDGAKTGVMAASGNNPSTSASSGSLELDIDQIKTSPYQPRKWFEPSALQDLAQSIKNQGLLQPIVVRPIAQGGFELIAGERRWRAAQLAGLTKIPVINKQVSDREASAIALIENIQREDLNALEEAVGLERLRNEFELTQQEVADVVGKSRAAIANSLRLLSLGSIARELLEDGKLDMGHSRALLGLTGTAQDQAALKVADGQLSVRDTEALVRKLLQEQQRGVETKAKPEKDADTQRLERKLMDHLGAQVNIKHGKSGRGELVIKYSTLEELDGVLSHFSLSD
ncbi:ParB/RepB/Spo0J family partition protein [Pseudomonadales bacterium]|nr:ParB/RepB/Spo0J family partition protein [Pseudomonadales bacterium]